MVDFKYVIDDDKVLSHWYDDRETFVVCYDKDKVYFDVDDGEVRFRLKNHIKEK